MTVNFILSFSLFLSVLIIGLILWLKRKAEIESRMWRERSQQITTNAHRFMVEHAIDFRRQLQTMVGAQELYTIQSSREALRDYFDLVGRNSQELIRQLERIQLFSELEIGALQADAGVFSLGKCIQQAIFMAKNRTRTFELHIKQEIANSVPDFLFGSEILLRNVLAELVDNSIRHRVNGKIVVRAEHLQDGKSAIRFSVINLGSQVSEGELARLKDLSQAQKSEWNSVGEGLGLVIIHKVLKRFSSQLSVEVVSSDELVISFVVDAEYLRAAREPDRLMLGVSNLLRVLVVDDESITRQVFGAYLKRLNASVDFAINGKEAVVKAKSRPYDAIFMDLSMPILNGFVAARVILQMDSPYPKPKIIAISSHCRQVDRDRCQGIGIFKLLEKPVRLDDLREALDQIQVRSSEDPLLVDWNTSTKK